MRFLQNLTFAAAAFAGLSLAASAQGGIPQAGSLLIFTTFENGRGDDTLITVTNTNGDHTPTVGTLEAGTVDVEFVYIDGYDCIEFNRTRRLTPNDTITVSARADNPNDLEGYVYVFAKSPTSGQAISWNWLIGIERTVEGGSSDEDFDVNPYVFKAVGAQGSNTDLNSDGNRQLDGLEYEAAPDRLLVPRFVGQGNGNESELTLINLTGGGQFTAIVDFLIYNDNEEVFSAQYSFFCWYEVDLEDISGLFDEDFLESTNHNLSENALGNEYGWFRLDGNIAFSTADSELDPVILAMLAENIGSGDGGELPFGEGTQTNGEVLSFSIFHP
jgi:hypothetical protein